MRLLLLGIALATAPLASHAELLATRRSADLWPESAGLPHNLVSCILQTRDGYIWVGTRGGIARFDGVRFTVFDDRKSGQLLEGEVWALAEDDASTLWIGTYGGGLTRFADGTFTTYTTRDGLPSDQITALAVGPGGTLFVGTSEGLARRRGARFETLPPEADIPGRRIQALHADAQGTVWIGTDSGLASYDAGRFVNHTRAHPLSLSGPIDSLAGDGKQGLWLVLRGRNEAASRLCLLTAGGVRTFTKNDGLLSDRILSLAIDADRTLHVGTRAGLFRYRGGRFEFQITTASSSGRIRDSLSRHAIPSLYVDRENNLWFGTRAEGLGRLRNTPFLETGVPDDVDVRAVLEATPGVWLGTADGLVRVVEGRLDTWSLPDPKLAANSLASTADAALLVGTPRGLYRWSSGRFGSAPLAGTETLNVSSLWTDGRGTTWIGTREDGLYGLAAGRLRHYTPSDGLLGTEVRGIASDSRGDVWIGTRNGGVSRLRAGSFTAFGPERGLPSAAVQAVFVDSDDDVWVATRRGLCRIRGETVKSVASESGLPARYFYQIAEDDLGHLWLTHARGIARIPKEQLNAVAEGAAVRVEAEGFDTETGMQSASMTVGHQSTALRTRDGRLWFATTHGVVVLDARVKAPNTLPPPVVIEDVRGAREERADEFVLEPMANEVEITYTGLSFVAPQRVGFRYRLLGFDADWVEAGTRRTAFYTNLPPGSYRFHVIACNNDGVWNEQGASVSLRVRPRFYQRGDVRLLAVAAAMLLALALHRLRTARLRARERQLMLRVAERTQALSDLTASLEKRVTERTAELAAANTALTAEKERLAVTLKSIGDGVIATDIEARIMLMNRVAEQITGWSVADAAGRALGEVFHTVDRRSRVPLPDPTRSSRERAVPGGFTAPCLLLTRDGREVLVADSAAPIRDPDSRVIGAVLVFRDVTERDRIEDQLRNAQKLEALGVLAGGIAHDFNNLLTGVFGFVDVARIVSPEPSKARDLLDTAMRVLEKARGLTRQLLTFAKAGEPIRRSLRLGELVRDAAAFSLSGSDVVADIQCADGLWSCEVDEQQIHQVVDNLVLNARQAMPAGGTLSIRLRNLRVGEGEVAALSAGPHVCLSVTDQGPGIPYELRARVFEPFFTTKAGGTGLGLAIVYSIVRKHGGAVTLESEPGKGTTFHVFLPARPDTVPAESAAPRAPIAAGGRGRILVMDDEPYVREVTKEGLEYLGYEVLLARDDEEAVSLLAEALACGKRVSAAILDLTIPGGHGGVAALGRLHALAPDLPAIAASGYSGDPVMARPEANGFAAAIAKPFIVADLARVLGRVVGGRPEAPPKN